MTETPDSPSSDNVTNIHRSVSLQILEAGVGFAVRAPRGQKDPGRGWDPKANTPERSHRILYDLRNNPQDNIGIHVHGSVVDVDIDTDNPYMLKALDAFLPPSAHVWGRKSRPRTHRLYDVRVDFDPTEWPILRRLNRNKELSVEVRGGNKSRGEYSLLPGSIHPSGEDYEWDNLGAAKNSLSTVDTGLIMKGIRLAAACAVVLPYWVEGARNELVMALSGFLYRAWETATSMNSGQDDGYFVLDRDAGEVFLSTLMQLAGDDQKDIYSRIKTFHATWKKAEGGAKVTGAARIAEVTGNKELPRRLYSFLLDSEDISIIDEFVERFVIWTGHGNVICTDPRPPKRVMTRQQFVNSESHHHAVMGGKRIRLAEALFSMKATDRVDGLTFDPTAKPGDIIAENGKRHVNDWVGWRSPAWEAPVSDEEVAMFTDYIFTVVSNQSAECYAWVMSWLSSIFKEPTKKPGTALVIVGKQGSGKSWLGEQILDRIIGGAHFVVFDKPDQLTGQFNTLLDRKLVVQCDEMTNNRQKATFNKLKAMITQKTIQIEPKGVDPYHMPNHMRFIFTSNDVEDSIHLSEGKEDRRYTVLETNNSRKDDLAYWSDFIDWLDEPDVPSKIHRWLRDYDISSTLTPVEGSKHVYWSKDGKEKTYLRVNRPFLTQAKTEMTINSLEPIDMWLMACVARGFPLSEDTHRQWYEAITVDHGVVRGNNRTVDRTVWPTHVAYTALVKDYTTFCKSHNISRWPPLDESSMGGRLQGRGLHKAIPESWKKHRPLVEMYDDRTNMKIVKRVQITPWVPLQAIIRYFDEKHGIKLTNMTLDDVDDIVQMSGDDEGEF